MNIAYWLKTVLLSLNPNSYKNLSSRKISDAFNHFFLVLIFSLIIFVILFVPFMLSFSSSLEKDFGKIDSFVVDVNLSAAQPITILSHPFVMIDLQKENLTSEQVLINENFLQYRPYYFFGKKTVSLDEFKDLKLHQEKAMTIMVLLFVFMLPAILVLFFLVFAIKNLLLALILSIIGFIIFRISRYDIKFFSLLKTGLYASTILFIPELGLLLFYPVFLITTALYVLLFILGSWSIAKKRFSIKKSKQREFPEKN